MAAVRAGVVLVFSGIAHGAVITAGTPTMSVPPSLIDTLGVLTDPLPANRYLLPIEVSGASGLQDWSFDLLFDPLVVAPVDAGLLDAGIFASAFSALDPTPSSITSAGFYFGGDRLEGVAGFSSGVSGSGVLAYALFELVAGDINDAGFGIDNEAISQAPEPDTAFLLMAALLTLGWLRYGRGASRRPPAR